MARRREGLPWLALRAEGLPSLRRDPGGTGKVPRSEASLREGPLVFARAFLRLFVLQGGEVSVQFRRLIFPSPRASEAVF